MDKMNLMIMQCYTIPPMKIIKNKILICIYNKFYLHLTMNIIITLIKGGKIIYYFNIFADALFLNTPV